MKAQEVAAHEAVAALATAPEMELLSIPAVVAALDVGAMQGRASAAVALRGRTYFMDKGRFKVERVSDLVAAVQVRSGSLQRVVFELSDGRAVALCECFYDEGVAEVVCEHKIAAALFLLELFELETETAVPVAAGAGRPVLTRTGGSPERWREQLAHLLSKETLPVAPPQQEGLLFFSFVRRHHRLVLQPGVISALAVPSELWRDRRRLSAYLVEHQSDPYLRSFTGALEPFRLDSYRWVNAAPGHCALVAQALQQSSWAYRNQGPPNWEGLADALVFRGDDQQLIREPLEVSSDVARLELEMEREAGGLRLSLVAALRDRTIKLNAPKLEIFNTHPLWLCEGAQLFQAGIEWHKLNLLCQQTEIVVPPEAMDEFYQRNFAELAAVYDLRGENVVAKPLAGVQPQPRIYLTEQEQQLRVQLRFTYSGFECGATKQTIQHSYVRDVERDVLIKIERRLDLEGEWWQRLGREEFGLKCGNPREGMASDIFVLRAKVHPFDFLKNFIPKLTEAGVEVFGEADLKLARINRARATISFNVASGIDWFDVKAVVHFGELQVSLAEVRKALRRQERFIKLADGSIGEIPPEWLEKYKHLFGLGELREDGLRVARHHVALLDQLLGEDELVAIDRQFDDARGWLRDLGGIPPQTLPASFQGELRPYQKAGFDWLHFLRSSRFGGCLADDMGTGKTIQTLCFLQSVKDADEGRNKGKRKREARSAHLLVVPRSLVTNWEREAQRFTPGLKVLNFAGAERAADVQEFNNYDVVLTTYGILLREIERLMEYQFDTVILDEAQAIKNPLSESAKAARLVKCRHRLTLTGTPVENSTLELWSQFAFLNPGLLGSLDYFREDFSGPIERHGDEQATRTLRRLVYPFILRRTKDQVALDLPPRSEEILWNEMEPEQRLLYNQTRDEYRATILKLIEAQGLKDARFRILEGLLRLRQICNHPRLVDPTYQGASAKLETLLETLETLQAGGHKALIFSQFVQMLKLIERELKKTKISYTYLDGSTVNRQARVDAFQTNSEIRAFLISLRAGGVGLNLTAADYVIHVDPWWNPAVEMQATDRAHRIGQDKPVFVYKLLIRDSVEEKILQLQDRKRDLVKQLITTESGFFKSLTEDDIASLFS
ncbi:MAG TPA: SNF2-related protein [Blastocatellia bacterium]|nr:SNF2-related protein [Blastocatellia bacterium]